MQTQQHEQEELPIADKQTNMNSSKVLNRKINGQQKQLTGGKTQRRRHTERIGNGLLSRITTTVPNMTPTTKTTKTSNKRV